MMMKAVVPLLALFALVFSQQPNDDVCNAVELSYEELANRCLHVEFDLNGATVEEGEVVPPVYNGDDNDQQGWWTPLGPNHTVWYHFLAKTDTTLGLLATSPILEGVPSGDPRIAVWSSRSATDCDGFNEFTPVASNDDGCSPVINDINNPEMGTATIDDCFSCAYVFNAYIWAFNVKKRQHYWIQIDGYKASEITGTLQVSTTRGPPPYFGNDTDSTGDDDGCGEYGDRVQDCRKELNALTVGPSSPHHEAYMMARDALLMVDDILEKEAMGVELMKSDFSNSDFAEWSIESFANEKRSVRNWDNWCPKADTFLRCVKCTVANKVKSTSAKNAIHASLLNLEKKIAQRC